MWQKHKVITLPSNYSTRIEKIKDERYKYSQFMVQSNAYGVFHHMFILSDEEVQEGDWCIYDNKEISKAKDWKTLESLKYLNAKKIVATTDNMLGLPLLRDNFILDWTERPTPEIEVFYIELGRNVKSKTYTIGRNVDDEITCKLPRQEGYYWCRIKPNSVISEHESHMMGFKPFKFKGDVWSLCGETYEESELDIIDDVMIPPTELPKDV